VAAAVLEWAKDNGASSYCHWFQPLGSSILRHGLSGQVQNRMMEFDSNGELIWKFEGKHLLRGETDGSSYPSGGLRSTHRAGGYTCIDPTSPIFIREDAVFIPAAFVSYLGDCLDEKTPLLRSLDALGDQGARLLKLLGFRDVEGSAPLTAVQSFIGLEQEFFFIPRDAYLNRTDLQLAGRTVLGRLPPRGQEASDHYMSPISLASPALACMQEIQDQCFKMGIPLKTRHREVAPNQYELVPLFGHVTSQVDQNILLMQIVEEVAVKHNLAALFHEKPFQGVNGSGKHNNWSLRTNDGTNIFNSNDMYRRTGTPLAFAVVIAALVRAVDKYGDLVRLGCGSPGNDFRLGACEAPPAIISLYLGENMTNYLDTIRSKLTAALCC
jgi:glutamine synthetase